MIEQIKLGIKEFNSCKQGKADLKRAKTVQDIFNLYFKYIDFALAKNYPGTEMLKKLNAFEAGIVVDRRYIFSNPEKLVILGKSDIEVSCNGFAVTRIYVKHDSKLIINATDNAYVVIDALDNSEVFCIVNGSAKVVVNLYANAVSHHATKSVIKNKFTYDL